MTSLVRVPAEEPVGQVVAASDSAFRFVTYEARYDGRYFFAVAVDPLATGAAHESIDYPAYRYGHPAYGWIAGMLSLGRPGLVPWTLLIVGLFSLAGAAASLAVLAKRFALTPWTGLAVAVNPGLIYAVTSDTSEPLAAALLGIGLLLWLDDRVVEGGLALILLCFVKEQFVVIPIGLAIWEISQAQRAKGKELSWSRLVWLGTGPVLLGCWFLYLRTTIGAWPFADAPGNLGMFLVGWVDAARRAASLSLDGGNHQVGAIALPLLVVTGVVLVLLGARAMRFRSPLDAPVLGLILLFGCLTWLALLFPKDLLRNVSTLMYLLPLVLFGRWRGNTVGQETTPSGSDRPLQVDR